MEPVPEPRPRPQRGGALVVGVVGEPATLDPYSPRASDLTRALARPLYPSLFRLAPDGSVDADLAESLEEQDGEARVVLADRRWSTGRPITAGDVVASVSRARPPSGFAGLGARRIDRRTVALSGRVDDWALTLARATLVLPRGRARPAQVTGGPFRLTDRTPGLRLVYEPDAAWEGEGPFLERATVTFVETDSLLLDLLAAEEIDVAVTPVALNLDERLAERGMRFESAVGWDALVLDFDPAVGRPARPAGGGRPGPAAGGAPRAARSRPWSSWPACSTPAGGSRSRPRRSWAPDRG
jgi:ABC-type transport system substrate-binding protein